ncbi:MAG TPA: Rossmann-like and DUF2520 domain-containing protein [Euzebyales bacterium]|nr:Rossmann-like and DUF2520 domain-containing protein [Euzebyales bacterium]
MTSDDVASLSVGVIGPGRVGTALALALADAGHPVVAVAGRAGIDDPAAATFAATVPVSSVTTPARVVAVADLVLLTVGDDALPALVRDLATDDAVHPGVRVVHTSGRHGVAVLRPVALAGARVVACHPAQTFPTPAAGRRDLPGTAWAVTAASGDREWAHALVTRLGGDPVDVREEDRVRYHAALSVGANGTSAVVALARDLLFAAGIDAPGRFLTPLATSSAGNAAEHGAAALTGPVRRGDRATIDAHLADLRMVLPEAVPAYRALARLALSYARRAGLDEERAAAIRTILDAE